MRQALSCAATTATPPVSGDPLHNDAHQGNERMERIDRLLLGGLYGRLVFVMFGYSFWVLHCTVLISSSAGV